MFSLIKLEYTGNWGNVVKGYKFATGRMFLRSNAQRVIIVNSTVLYTSKLLRD